MATATTLTSAGISRVNRLSAYVALGKPRIGFLVVLSTLAGAAAAGLDRIPVLELFTLLAGVALSSYAAAALNNHFDRDIDARMFRTRRRPLPAGQIEPSYALLAGSLAGVCGVALLFASNGPLPAALVGLTFLVYNGLYTTLLKRRTPVANEVGGLAGAMPPVIGWAAVAGGLSLEPFILFLVMFFWQPPHFWTLASHYREDYGRAGIPVLPVVASVESAYARSFIYAVILAGVSVLPFAAGFAGPIYLAVALALGLTYAARLRSIGKGGSKDHFGAFKFSIVHLVAFWAVYLADRIPEALR